jgi:hypothetical protein
MRTIAVLLGAVAAGAVLLIPAASSASEDSAATAKAGWTVDMSLPAPTSSSGIASTMLNAVSCSSATRCMAVGSYQYPYGNGSGPASGTVAERWNGRGWKLQLPPSPEVTSVLNAVSCVSAANCTAVGSTGISATLPLAEHWNGHSWKVQHTPDPAAGGTGALAGVSCASAHRCTAVGPEIAEHWNGSRWRAQSLPVGATSVSCTSSLRCVATDGRGVERWRGAGWQGQRLPGPAGSIANFSAVSCAAANSCTAVGTYNSTATDETGLLADHWNGHRWKLQATPSTGSSPVFGAVSCASAASCTAVGQAQDDTTLNQFAIAEHWNGRNWRIQQVPGAVGIALTVSGVSCPSTASCVAVGYAYQGGAAPFQEPLAARWSRTAS